MQSFQQFLESYEIETWVSSIWQTPKDHTKWLAFADFLDESGQPLGEYIRILSQWNNIVRLHFLAHGEDDDRAIDLRAREDKLRIQLHDRTGYDMNWGSDPFECFAPMTPTWQPRNGVTIMREPIYVVNFNNHQIYQFRIVSSQSDEENPIAHLLNDKRNTLANTPLGDRFDIDNLMRELRPWRHTTRATPIQITDVPPGPQMAMVLRAAAWTFN